MVEKHFSQVDCLVANESAVVLKITFACLLKGYFNIRCSPSQSEDIFVENVTSLKWVTQNSYKKYGGHPTYCRQLEGIEG